MAKTPKTLTCTFFVGGKQVEKLTEEQLDRMAERISETMSLYYANHPEEFAILCENDRKGEQKNGKLYSKNQDTEAGCKNSLRCL